MPILVSVVCIVLFIITTFGFSVVFLFLFM